MDHGASSWFETIVYVLVSVFGLLFSVIGALLSRKDSAQGRQIDMLFDKHDQDEKALQDFKIEIAKEHYSKDELNTKFDRIDRTLDSMSLKLDKVLQAVNMGPHNVN